MNGSIFHLTDICKNIENLMQEEIENLFYLEPRHYEYDVFMYDAKTNYGFLRGKGYISIRLIVRRDVSKLREEDIKRIEKKIQNLYKSSDIELYCKLIIFYAKRFDTKKAVINSVSGISVNNWYDDLKGCTYNGFVFSNPFFRDCELMWVNLCPKNSEYALNEHILNFEVRKLTRLLNRPIFIKESEKSNTK